MSMMGIDRQAFLVYLRDCRDVEVELYQLNNMLTKEQRDYEQKIRQAQYQYQPNQSGMPEKPELIPVKAHWRKPGLISSCIMMIAAYTCCTAAVEFFAAAHGILCTWVANTHIWKIFHIPFKKVERILLPIFIPLFGEDGSIIVPRALAIEWLFLAAAGIIIFLFSAGISESNEEQWNINENNKKRNQTAIENYNLAVEQYKQLCTRTQQYRELEQQFTQQHDQTMTALNAQKQKVEALREEIYKVNLIPKQYRDVSHMYYIYDYMSTSQATFEDTLNHAHLENGFQRILDKLEEIIAQQYQQIHEAREMEARSKADSERTLNMLHRLGEQSRATNAQLAGMNSTMGQIAENTSNAAYYAEIAADYSKVCAYFDTYDHFMQ